MKKVWTILFVDVLSIISLPFLLTGMVLHLVSALVGGCLIFPLIIVGVLLWALLHAMIADLNVAIMLIAMLIVGALFFLIISFVFQIATSIYIGITGFLQSILSGAAIGLESIYLNLLCYMGRLLEGCDESPEDNVNVVALICCFPFFVNWICYFLVNQLLRFCKVLAVLASAGVIGIFVWELMGASEAYLGTTLWSAIGLFSVGDIILSVIDLGLILAVLIWMVWYVGMSWASLHDAFEEAGVGDAFVDCFQSIKNIN